MCCPNMGAARSMRVGVAEKCTGHPSVWVVIFPYSGIRTSLLITVKNKYKSRKNDIKRADQLYLRFLPQVSIAAQAPLVPYAINPPTR